MHLEYFGHSCFGLVSAGQRCLIDPYHERVGYKLPQKSALVTLVSHDHFDHNHTAAVNGRTQVIKGIASHQVGPFQISGVLSDHDDCDGQRFGKVVIFVVEVEGLRLVHLSDLGRLLRKDELEELGAVDVLLVPCGGGQYTLDCAGAAAVVAQVKPKLTIPMHYRTPFLNRSDFPQLEGPDKLVQKLGASRREGLMTVAGETLAKESAWLMSHLG